MDGVVHVSVHGAVVTTIRVFVCGEVVVGVLRGRRVVRLRRLLLLPCLNSSPWLWTRCVRDLQYGMAAVLLMMSCVMLFPRPCGAWMVMSLRLEMLAQLLICSDAPML